MNERVEATDTHEQQHAPITQATTQRRSYSSLLLAISNLGVFAFPFLRGVVLAHLLSPRDFGQAISITTVASVVDIISDVGLYQYAVRNSNAAAVPTLQSIALVRALLIAAVIVLCSPLCAYLFDAPGTAWAYATVGIAPLIRGFYHLNVKTAMRNFDFTKEAITELVGHAVWTVVSIAAAFLLHDYRAMIIGLVANALSIVAMTHLLSKSRWSLGWDKAVVKDAARFGRPLIPNGAATVLVTMGDRTLIGSHLGLDALASYSVLTTSAFLPRSAILRYVNALVTPQFVHASTPEHVDRLLIKLAIILSWIGALFAFGYMALGQLLISMIFGQHYTVSQSIVSLIGVLSCIRFLAALTTSIGVAKGNTKIILLNTVTSAAGLALGLLIVFHSPTLESMVLGMCVGELAALIYIIAKLLDSSKAAATSVWSTVLPTLALVLACGTIILTTEAQSLLSKVGIALSFMAAESALLTVIMFRNHISLKEMIGVFLPGMVQRSS